MKFLSKVIIVFLMIALALATVSCSPSTGDSSSSDSKKEDPKPTPTPTLEDYEIPLTLEFIADGEITITNPWSTLKYSKNDGELTAVQATGDPLTALITVAKDDKISFFAEESENISSNMTIGCNSDCYIYGNVMSLVSFDAASGKWDSTAKTITSINCFRSLFYKNSHIKNHKDRSIVLPATTLKASCYEGMFYDCSSLTSAPALPATSLAEGCYCGMFYCCTSLTSAPALPATSLANSCYDSMFYKCTSLSSAPVLPATSLANSCYRDMFHGCTSLSSAPVLPATSLTGFCYRGMFSGCTSLTSAPVLPATTLASYCYSGMFDGCINLNYIKCLATNISKSACTESWVQGVAASGTFVQADGMTGWTTGDDGIPAGWTVEDAQ